MRALGQVAERHAHENGSTVLRSFAEARTRARSAAARQPKFLETFEELAFSLERALTFAQPARRHAVLRATRAE